MVWDGIYSKGWTLLHIVDCSLTAVYFQEIVEEYIPQTKFIIRPDFHFLDNNAWPDTGKQEPVPLQPINGPLIAEATY